MRLRLPLLTIIFLLTLSTNVHGQVQPKNINVKPATDMQKVDINKVNANAVQPNLPDLKIKHFTGVKFGSPSQPSGANELVLVDRLFPVINTTTITIKGKAKTPTVVTVTEDLSINVNTRDFNHFSAGAESWLKAGNVLNVLSFLATQPNGVTNPRNPIKLSINLPGVANSTYLVQNPEQNSKLLRAEEYLIAQNARPATPKLSFSFHKIHSVEEMEFKLTGKYRGLLSSFSTEVGLKPGNQQMYHYYVLEFRQNMFSIQTEDIIPLTIFKQFTTDMAGYIYIDKVDYGRSGVVIFKSTQTLEDLGITAAANYNFGLSEDKMRTVYNQLKGKKEVEMFAHFYGATSLAGIQSMENNVKNGSTDIFSLIRTTAFDYRLALPIGYTIKNMNNQQVGLKSNKTQTVTTKTPAPPASTYTLKVTLTDIQCIKGRDGGGSNPDDYAIQQHIVYKALGKDKKFVTRDIRKFPGLIDKPGQVPGIINPLIYSDISNQIHVKENTVVQQRNRTMINNSLVFDITLDELNDPKASFEIFTWVKEYTTDDYGLRWDFLLIKESIKVKIKDVVEILQGRRNLVEKATFPDAEIGKGIKFHNFGSGFMHLANIQKTTPLVLEGPIIGNYPKNSGAAVWVQFELIK
ncbi:MAG: thiol-activated cytolysin family protein [Ginsengibacter sp.]